MIVTYIDSKHELGDVYSYFFKPQENLQWTAGEYLNYALPGLPPAEAERLFTICSAPHEGVLRVTTINGISLFKQKLRDLKRGDEVEVDQLGGNFVWEDDGRKKLYLAGGIGATPFRSIVLDRLHTNKPNDATLLYAGKNDHRPFLDELEAAAKQDPTFTKFDYDTKRISVEEILNVVPDYKDRTIYIAGPQLFVEGLGDALAADGVDRSQIKYDWFDGYHHDV